jgi:quercetin dioxygenase-like cupin family protein
MLSALSLLFFLPAALLLWLPMLAIINGVYDGDQALAGVAGLAFALPGLVLVGVDLIRKGWRHSFVGLVGIGLLATPFIALLAYGGACEVTGRCGDTVRPPSQQVIRGVKAADIVWGEGGGVKGLTSARVIGEPGTRGMHVVRSKIAQGAQVQPHAHTHERVLSIVSGTLLVASGEEFNEGKLLRYGAGDLLTVPAHVMHYFSAPDGEVVFDEYGWGATKSYGVGEEE